MSWATEVAADTPLAWWRLSDASGTTAADTSGNSHPGTLTASGITYSVTGAISGDANKALGFATTGAMSAALNLSAQNKITVEFWLNWTTYAADDRPVVEYTANGKTTVGGFAITPNGSGTPSTGLFEVTMFGGGSCGFVRPQSGKFHHYVVHLDRTKHPADGGIRLWCDGVEQAKRWQLAGIPSGNFANSTVYAMARGATSLFAAGTLDELAIYSGLLSEARITAHKQAGQPTHTLDTYDNEVAADSPLVAWKLAETSGTTAADASGNSHPGTYAGTVTLNQAGPFAIPKAVTVAGAGSISGAVNLSAQNKITVEFWLYWPSGGTGQLPKPSNDQMILEYTTSGAGAGGFSYSNIGGTDHQIRIVVGGMTVEFAPAASSPVRRISFDRWHHIVIQLDRTQAQTAATPAFRHGDYGAADNQAVKLYVDGIRRIPTSVTGATAPGGNFANSSLYLLARNNASFFATARMSQVAIYPGILDIDRIDCHLQAGFGTDWIHPQQSQAKGLHYALWQPEQAWRPSELFSGVNIWEDTLPSDAPAHASSATWIANLRSQLDVTNLGNPAAHSFAYYNGTPPIYVVPDDYPTIPVANGEVAHPEVFGPPWPRMFTLHEEFMAGVPLPDHALTDASTDRNLVVWRPGTNDYWEMWVCVRENGTEPVASRPFELVAYGGGHMRDTSISKGYYKDRFASGVKYEDRFDGTTATGMLFAGGVVSWDEWNADQVNHALHMIVGNAWTQFFFPASRGDGQNGSTWIPEGAWLRLDPAYNVDAHFPPASAGGTYIQRKVNALCKAAQTYGIFITDKTGNAPTMRFQSTYGWIAGCDNPIIELDKVGSSTQLRDDIIMTSIPWDQMMVLDPVWVADRWDEPPLAPTTMDTLIEDFAAGTIDGSKWPSTVGAVTVVSGQGNIRVNPTTAGVAVLDTGTTLYSLTGTEIAFEAVQMPSDVAATEGGMKLVSSANSDGYSFVEFVFSDAKLIADYRDATSANNRIRVAQPTYDPVAHRWLKIRESAGTVYWEVSPDGANWNAFGSVVWASTGWPAENLNSLRVQFFSDNYNAVPGARAFIVDNVNVAPVGPPPPSPALAVSPSSLSFDASEGGASPTPKTATVTNAGGGTLDITVSDDAFWLDVTPEGPTVPGVLTIWPSVVGLAAGTYTGTVTVTATTPNATGSPKTINVVFTVGPPPPAPPVGEPSKVYAIRSIDGERIIGWWDLEELGL